MRSQRQSLSNLLFGQTRGRILTLLYGLPDETFYGRQIARQTATSAGTVQRELKLLSGIGLISRSNKDRQVLYRANTRHPSYPEIRSLVAKNPGIFEQLRSALAPLGSRIDMAFIYGSIARGEEDANSDVDLLVISEATLDEILTPLLSVERVVGRAINPTVYSLREFKSKMDAGNHFLHAVMRGSKVVLIGGEDEPGEMG
jgi:predicted nucleotidyltransferase